MIYHAAANCVGNWRCTRPVGTSASPILRCDRCGVEHPATPENRLAAIDENYAGIYLRHLADEGAAILAADNEGAA